MNRNHDFFGLLVRFIIGAAYGAVLGLAPWVWINPESKSTGIACIFITAAITGLAAAYYSDNFWTEKLKKLISWWYP